VAVHGKWIIITTVLGMVLGMVLGIVLGMVMGKVKERVQGRRLLMDVIQIPNANITPAKVSVLETVVLDHHRHPVMLLLSAMDTTAARVMLLLFALDPPAAPVIQIPNVNWRVLALTAQDVVLDHHRLFQFHHRNHVNFVLMALVRIAALVIQILCAPLNVLPVETVVLNHHHPVSFVLLVALVPIAALVIQILCAHLLAESTVVYHHHHHPVSIVHLEALVRIVVLVIPILCVPLNVLPVETVVYHRHYHHHPVSFVLLAVVESIAVLVIPSLGVLAVIPVTTVVSEKNASKSVNLLAVAVTVVRVVKEERVEKVDTTAAAAMEERVVKVEKEERVDTMVDTKFVTSSVTWSPINKLYLSMEMRTLLIGHYILSSILVEHTM